MKRILIISNNCFSKINSNGRTLGNLFYLYDKSKIAQFYISGEPDYDFCCNYFKVSDLDVLNSTVLFKKKKKDKDQKQPKSKRTVKNMILRNIIWNIGLWKTKQFKKWLKDFNPEIVLLQVGDCTFMIKLAMQIAIKFGANLVLYNTEAYYFKEKNYFIKGSDFLYKIFIKNYRKNFRKIIQRAKISIYLNEKLKKLYDNEFSKPSDVIYNSSCIETLPFKNSFFPIISYIGNLELDRYKSICDIAEILEGYGLTINVYGKAKEDIIAYFKRYKAINYCGFIMYDEVKTVIEKSHILFHVEGFSDFYLEDSKYGFSGKIADSLMSGKAFLLYCPKQIACAEYLISHSINAVASSKKELGEMLKKYVFSIENCISLAQEELFLGHNNHSIATNSDKFIRIIEEV